MWNFFIWLQPLNLENFGYSESDLTEKKFSQLSQQRINAKQLLMINFFSYGCLWKQNQINDHSKFQSDLFYMGYFMLVRFHLSTKKNTSIQYANSVLITCLFINIFITFTATVCRESMWLNEYSAKEHIATDIIKPSRSCDHIVHTVLYIQSRLMIAIKTL